MAGQSTKITMTIPEPMLKAADRIAGAEYRTRAEVFREALREYIARRARLGPSGMAEESAHYGTREDLERAAAEVPLDDEPYTAGQRRRVHKAEEAIARGDCITLEQLKADLAMRLKREGGARVATRRRSRGPKAT
jgi:Arc/MetJ-type ribon-helix-helix transcriptional regulator